jgi:hypothetical protein
VDAAETCSPCELTGKFFRSTRADSLNAPPSSAPEVDEHQTTHFPKHFRQSKKPIPSSPPTPIVPPLSPLEKSENVRVATGEYLLLYGFPDRCFSSSLARKMLQSQERPSTLIQLKHNHARSTTFFSSRFSRNANVATAETVCCGG